MDTGTIMESPNLPGWANFPVRDDIQRRLGVPVILENDANSAAMGEKWLGAGRDTDHMAMYTLGTGVGGGLVLNGRLWHGMNGMAGELGHYLTWSQKGILVVVEAVAVLSSTRRRRLSCAWRTKSSRPAKRTIWRELPAAMSSSIHGSFINWQFKGTLRRNASIETVGRSLGVGIGGTVNAMNLPMYVVGGGVASAWDAFAPTMFEELKNRSFVYKVTAPDGPMAGKKHTIVTRALMGSDAGLYGAARLPMLDSLTQTEPTRGPSSA